ncbi:MAG: transposase, partial [Thiohalocapsa sp.]
GTRKPKDLPMFYWVNTVLGNLKTSLSGAYHAFGYSKYAQHYLGAIAYRFNRRFDLHALPHRLLLAAVGCGPHTERLIRLAEAHC